MYCNQFFNKYCKYNVTVFVVVSFLCFISIHAFVYFFLFSALPFYLWDVSHSDIWRRSDCICYQWYNLLLLIKAIEYIKHTTAAVVVTYVFFFLTSFLSKKTKLFFIIFWAQLNKLSFEKWNNITLFDEWNDLMLLVKTNRDHTTAKTMSDVIMMWWKYLYLRVKLIIKFTYIVSNVFQNWASFFCWLLFSTQISSKYYLLNLLLINLNSTICFKIVFWIFQKFHNSKFISFFLKTIFL